jgi:hypothetical protein
MNGSWLGGCEMTPMLDHRKGRPQCFFLFFFSWDSQNSFFFFFIGLAVLKEISIITIRPLSSGDQDNQ